MTTPQFIAIAGNNDYLLVLVTNVKSPFSFYFKRSTGTEPIVGKVYTKNYFERKCVLWKKQAHALITEDEKLYDYAMNIAQIIIQNEKHVFVDANGKRVSDAIIKFEDRTKKALPTVKTIRLEKRQVNEFSGETLMEVAFKQAGYSR